MTEKEVTTIVIDAIGRFNALSPFQRREARRWHRTRFVGDENYIWRPNVARGYKVEAETQYDNLDFAGHK
jgi:hypothetical protein